MPDISKHVEKFDGNKNAKMRIDKIKEMKLLHNWPDAFALEMARSNLEGGALNWWLARSTIIRTFSQFDDEFRKTFIQEEDLPTKWKKMTASNQERKESINDYYHDKYLVCSKLNLVFSEVKEHTYIDWSLR